MRQRPKMRERSDMRRRPLTAALLLGAGIALSGCASGYDTMDNVRDAFHSFNPFGTNEKPLPGQRRALFPDGVPGVEQGVPQHLMPGQRQEPDVLTATPAEPPVVEEARPRRAARPAARTRTTATTPQEPAPRQAARPRRAAPAPAQQPAEDTVWPAPQAAPPPDTVWPDPPQAQPQRPPQQETPRQARQQEAPPASPPPAATPQGGWAPPASEPVPTVWPDPPKPAQ